MICGVTFVGSSCSRISSEAAIALFADVLCPFRTLDFLETGDDIPERRIGGRKVIKILIMHKKEL